MEECKFAVVKFGECFRRNQGIPFYVVHGNSGVAMWPLLPCGVSGDLPVGNRIQSGYCCLDVNTVDEVMTFPKSLHDVIDFLDVVSVLAGVGHEYDGVYEGGGGGEQDGAQQLHQVPLEENVTMIALQISRLAFICKEAALSFFYYTTTCISCNDLNNKFWYWIGEAEVIQKIRPLFYFTSWYWWW